MHLRIYLKRSGLKQSDLARMTGLSTKTIWNAVNEHEISLGAAQKIEKATNGNVLCNELGPQGLKENERIENTQHEQEEKA